MPTSTTFTGLDNLGQTNLSEIIRTNLIMYFDWGFVDKGGFFNVRLAQTGIFSGDASRLRPVTVPGYSSGKVWESQYSNWVWESGTSQSTQPIAISGVWVNDSLLPHSDYTIDYPNGRIVFNTAKPLSSTVKVEHSYKYVYVTDARSIPFYRSPYFRNRVYDPLNYSVGSGQYTQLAQQRIPLPAVAVEVVDSRYRPFELGSGSRYVDSRVVCHILAESDAEASRIADAIGSTWEKNIHLFDVDALAEADRFPLTIHGDIASGAMVYPQLVAATGDGGFRYNGVQYGQARLYETEIERGDWQDASLYTSAVTMKVQVIQLQL